MVASWFRAFRHVVDTSRFKPFLEYCRRSASEEGLPKSYGICSFPSVFCTADVGLLRGVFPLVLIMSILENLVVFAIPRMAPALLGFVVAGMGPLSGKDLRLSKLGFIFFSSTMGTIDSLKSVLTKSALDDLCKKYYISDAVHPNLPGPNARIHRSPIDSLKNWNDHFFWVDASVFPLAISWHSGKTLRKDLPPIPHDFSVVVCDFLTDNPAPFKKFLKAFLCLVGQSRHYTLDENCYPTFWDDEDEVKVRERKIREGEVPLLDLTKDRVVPLASVYDRGNVAAVGVDDEAQALVVDKPKKFRKRKIVDGAGGFRIPPKKLRGDHDTSGDAGAITAKKSLAALQDLFGKSILATEIGVIVVATVPFVTSFVTPTLEYEGDEDADSVSAANVRTKRPAKRFVISSNTPHDSNANNADDEVYSVVRSTVLMSTVLIHVVLTIDVATSIVAGTSISQHREINEPMRAGTFTDSTSVGNVDPNATGPSQPTGNDISSESFYVSLDMDSEALR
uniref:Transposase (Putative), gypsy type n=1 Tax=Tanacetum cinerariifolium TaxID=118510 RepID=A0A6L2KFI7_TANCI|nr:hypothetical protein [Tanacetum cinerariifolium]